MMARLPLRIFALWVVLLLGHLSDARVVQDDWIYPLAPDFTTTLKMGETYTLKWTSTLWEWFSVYAPSIDTSNADLWITGYDLHQYQHLVAARVNINNTRYSLTWKVQLPESELDATDRWVFRFVPSGVVPLSISQQISSPGFSVLKAPTTSTTSATSSSILPSTTTSIPTSSQSAVTAASNTAISSPSSHSSSGTSLSGGALAGIVVGAVLGTAALIGLGWYLAHLKKKSANTNRVEDAGRYDNRTYPEVVSQSEKPGLAVSQGYYPQQTGSSGWDEGQAGVHELGQAQTPRLPAELGDSNPPRYH